MNERVSDTEDGSTREKEGEMGGGERKKREEKGDEGDEEMKWRIGV